MARPKPEPAAVGAEVAAMARPEVADVAAADHPAPTQRPHRRPAGVSVIVGGLLQDLENLLRRNLAPIEERVRPGAETRGLAGDPAEKEADPLVIVLPEHR